MIKKVLGIKPPPPPVPYNEHIIALIKSVRPYQTEKALIRLGGKGDGGYLVPDDLEQIEACFSPGVDQISNFEKDCAAYGMDVFMADKSVEAPALTDPKFHFIKKFIGPYTNEDFITMDEWVNETVGNGTADLLLQMDIEGAEFYSILNWSSALLKRFRVIVIEFHDFHKFGETSYYHLAKACFDKLLLHHTCVHIHPNNCVPPVWVSGITLSDVVEFTFYRNDRFQTKQPATTFPHPLDSANVPTNSDVVLQDLWYK